MKTHPLFLPCLLGVLASLAPLSLGTAQTALSPAAGSTVTPAQANRQDGFIVRNGVMHLVRNGVAAPLDREMTLKVTPQGVTGFDEVFRRLTPDAMLTMDGRIITPPADIVFAVVPQPLPPTTSQTEAERRLDRGVTGQNTSGLYPPSATPRRSEEGADLPGTPADRAKAIREANGNIRFKDGSKPSPTNSATINPNAVRTDLPGNVPAPSPLQRTQP